MVTDGKKHATSSDKSSRHATPLSSNSGPRDKIRDPTHFPTGRGLGEARTAVPGCWRAPFVVNSHGVMSCFGAGTHEPRRESGRPPRPPVQMRQIAHPPSANSSGLGVSSP